MFEFQNGNLKKIPRGWNNGIIFPIFNKGNRTKHLNYRRIMLLSVPHTILSIILLKWLKIYSGHVLNQY